MRTSAIRRRSGERQRPEAEIKIPSPKLTELQKWGEWYKNPVINAAMTFLEPLPVGLLLALISAGLLRRRFAGTELSPRVAT